jgi:hypothetical protein
MVINGRTSLVGNRLAEVEAAVAAAAPLDGPAISFAKGKVEIAAGAVPATPADVWLVRYDPATVEVPVRRGENGGRTLAHTHVVHDLQRLGQWDGGALSLAMSEAAAGLETAVLVQLPNGGPILSAAAN